MAIGWTGVCNTIGSNGADDAAWTAAVNDAAAIGPASDIYSLAPLIHAADRATPFQAASFVETLNQVIDSEPISPRLLNPAVPRPGDDLPQVPRKSSRTALFERRRNRRRAGAFSASRANPFARIGPVSHS